MVQKVSQDIDSKYIDFVVAYNRKVDHNKSIYEIDVRAHFWDLFRDKYSTTRYSTPRETQSRTRQKLIFNLKQDDKEEK